MAKHALSILAFVVLLLTSSASAQVRDAEHSQFLPDPHYPRQAALECVQGKVLARFTVSETFEPSDIQILSSVPENVFDQVVLDTLDKWIVNAEPGSEITERFDFELDGCG